MLLLTYILCGWCVWRGGGLAAQHKCTQMAKEVENWIKRGALPSLAR
jgi:hypothetical protein